MNKTKLLQLLCQVTGKQQDEIVLYALQAYARTIASANLGVDAKFYQVLALIELKAMLNEQNSKD